MTAWRAVPAAESREFAGLSEAVVVEQAQYAAAVARAWEGQGVGPAVAGLVAEVAAVKDAARSGLFL